MEYIQQLSEEVISRLSQLGYNQELVLKLEQITSESDVLNKDKSDLRGILEAFFKATAKLNMIHKGAQFKGDWTRFSNVYGFVYDRERLTTTEKEFIKNFYGLLSDSCAAHDGESQLDTIVAAYTCWYIFDLVSFRVNHPLKREKITFEEPSAESKEIAEQFLSGLRTGRYEGAGFNSEFGREQMQTVRKMLKESDVPFLLNLLTEAAAEPSLRNRAASLLLSNKLIRNWNQRNYIVRQMNRYYWENKDTAPWQVLRSIALALNNRINETECILDYIERIKKDEALVEENLKVSDEYYGETSIALEYYVSNRINPHKIRSAGCFWEIFYVGRRAKTKDSEAKDVLLRRLRRTDNPKIQDMCVEAIQRIYPNFKDKRNAERTDETKAVVTKRTY